MRFKVERDALIKAAGQAARVARNAAPYHHARIDVEGDKAIVAADDFSVAVAVTVSVSTDEGGSVATSAKRLVEAARSLRPGAVEVVVDGAVLRLSCGPSRAEIPTIDAKDVPDAPTMGDGTLVDRAELVAAIGSVLPAVSRESERPILTGMLFDEEGGRLRLVATDSYRMHWSDTTCAWEGSILVPRLALDEFVRVDGDGPVAIERSSTSMAFGVADTVLRCRLIEGEFPRYRQLIPASMPHRLEAATEELADAVKRIGGDDTEHTRVTLQLEPERVRLSSKRSDGTVRDDEVAATWDGSATELIINSTFVAEALAQVGTDRVAFGVDTPLRPVLVEPVGSSSWRGLLVPIRVS